MQLWQVRVVQTNTKDRIVGMMERTTISITTAKEAKRGATIKKREEEKEEWYGMGKRKR